MRFENVTVEWLEQTTVIYPALFERGFSHFSYETIFTMIVSLNPIPHSHFRSPFFPESQAESEGPCEEEKLFAKKEGRLSASD